MSNPSNGSADVLCGKEYVKYWEAQTVGPIQLSQNAKKYPEIRKRGVYSDILGAEARQLLGVS